MVRKYKLFIPLMVSSVGLLLTLQFFWLSSVYKEYQDGFRQEAELLFRNTFTQMMDSVFLNNLQPADPSSMHLIDSLLIQLPDKVSDPSKKIEISIGNANLTDSLKKIDPKNIRKIQIISTNPVTIDSIKEKIRPLGRNLESLDGEKKFVITLRDEKLDTEKLLDLYNQALLKNGYSVTPKILAYQKGDKAEDLPQGAFALKEVFYPPGNTVQVFFEDIHLYFLRKMTVPVLFSLLVIVVVSLSLWMMFKNIRKQEQLNAIKNDIINNITHELKTPVATVSIVLESLENFGARNDAKVRKEYLQIAKNELKRLTGMADNILRSSVLGLSSTQNFKEIDLSEILEEQLQSLRPLLESKHFELLLEEKGNHFKIMGNKEQVGLVIFNLLDNAIKYSRERFYLKIKLLEEDNQLILKVEDKGIGIPEEFQKDVFEKFIRVPQENLHDVKGYGLGLAQVKEIVHLHKGKISLKSQFGHGSQFTVQFPKA